jgi:hypothetical protein
MARRYERVYRRWAEIGNSSPVRQKQAA